MSGSDFCTELTVLCILKHCHGLPLSAFVHEQLERFWPTVSLKCWCNYRNFCIRTTPSWLCRTKNSFRRIFHSTSKYLTSLRNESLARSHAPGINDVIKLNSFLALCTARYQSCSFWFYKILPLCFITALGPFRCYLLPQTFPVFLHPNLYLIILGTRFRTTVVIECFLFFYSVYPFSKISASLHTWKMIISNHSYIAIFSWKLRLLSPYFLIVDKYVEGFRRMDCITLSSRLSQDWQNTLPSPCRRIWFGILGIWST